MPRRLVIIRLLRRTTLALCLILIAAWVFSLFWWVDYVGPNSRLYWRHGVLGLKTVEAAVPGGPLRLLDALDDELHTMDCSPTWGLHVYLCPWLRRDCHVCPSWWLLSASGRHRDDDPRRDAKDFGRAVAITKDHAVVGVERGDFSRSEMLLTACRMQAGTLATSVAGLSPAEPVTPGDRRFPRIALSDQTLVIGQRATSLLSDDYVPMGVGVYTRSGGEWVDQPAFRSPEPTRFQDFGAAVAVDGDRIVVGAPIAGLRNRGTSLAWVFQNVDGAWRQEQRLAPPEQLAGASSQWWIASEDFGSSVGINGDTILVGAPHLSLVNDVNRSSIYFEGAGAVFVFRRHHNEWTHRQTLLIDGTFRSDGFGASIAMQEKVAAIAEASDYPDQPHIVHVYVKEQDEWLLQQRLPAPLNPAYRAAFARSIAIHGDTILVGACSQAPRSSPDVVFVYQRRDTEWRLVQMLEPPIEHRDLDFGASLAIHEDLAVIGAPQSQWRRQGQEGLALLYSRSDNAWSPCQTIRTSSSTWSDWYSVWPPLLCAAMMTLVFRLMENRIQAQSHSCLRCGRGEGRLSRRYCMDCERRRRRRRRRWGRLGLLTTGLLAAATATSVQHTISWRAGVWHERDACAYGTEFSLSRGELSCARFDHSSRDDAEGIIRPSDKIGMIRSLGKRIRFRPPALKEDGTLRIPLWLPFAASLPWTIWLLRRSRVPPVGCCLWCGYNLTGNQSGICPECGEKCEGAVPSVPQSCGDKIEST